MYYGLTNYYQNHRRYVKSRDDNQLLGHLKSEPSTDCIPFAKSNGTGVPIAPCGAIANSLFNGNSNYHLTQKIHFSPKNKKIFMTLNSFLVNNCRGFIFQMNWLFILNREVKIARVISFR